MVCDEEVSGTFFWMLTQDQLGKHDPEDPVGDGTAVTKYDEHLAPYANKLRERYAMLQQLKNDVRSLPLRSSLIIS